MFPIVRDLGSRGDVVDRVSDRRLGREDVGARHVLDVDEVHRLRAIAEDDGRAIGRDLLHPAYEDFRVGTVRVDPRPVHR